MYFTTNLRKSKKRKARLACIFNYLDPDFIKIKYVCYANNSLLGITELEKKIEKIETRHTMTVDAPHFRSTHLTISTLVSCQETNGIVTVGPHTYRFGGKYPDDVWVEKKK
jgi:hypothetical protein